MSTTKMGFGSMTTNELYWLFSDHLQSSSVMLDEVGNVVNRTYYTAFGEIRNQTAASPTDYQYTGQRSYMDSEPILCIGFGANEHSSFARLKHDNVSYHYYVARWYDPVTAHFAQADTIIPNPGNSGDWNRYAYVRNNPMRYIDPTGHVPTNMSLLQEQVEIEYYRYKITNLFGWDVSDINLTLSNLKNIFDAGYDIAQYVFKTCLESWIGVDGIEWVKKNLGNAIFKQNGSCFGSPCVPGKETIYFAGRNLSVGSIVHELGHVLENNGQKGAVWFGRGYGDELLRQNKVNNLYLVRWLNHNNFKWLNKSFFNQLDDNSMLLEQGNTAEVKVYGNGGPADYFADSFEFLVTGAGSVPKQTEQYFKDLVIDLASDLY